MLANAAAKAAGARSRAYKIFDDRGLFLFVAPAGLKSFRMKFRYQGREKLLTFGAWPDIMLSDVRARCDAAREQLRRGEDQAPLLPPYRYFSRQDLNPVVVT